MKKIILALAILSQTLGMNAQNTDCLVIPDTVDFGACAMALGIGITSSGCTYISGCGSTADNGFDYAGYFFTDIASCMACQDQNDCLSLPSSSDFGMCDMWLGFAMTENGCQSFSGCGSVDQNGTDYTGYFFDAEYACNNQCIGQVIIDVCVDESLINPDVLCAMIYDPVCGCDSITYSNECMAVNYGGVTSFTPGECIVGVKEIKDSQVNVFPNPFQDNLNISLNGGITARYITMHDAMGKLVYESNKTFTSNTDINTSSLSEGVYIISIYSAKNGIPAKKTVVK
jgi:Secretion system C-terminal sorting domain/Kazal-type serine protease inhibitor domain